MLPMILVSLIFLSIFLSLSLTNPKSTKIISPLFNLNGFIILNPGPYGFKENKT